jgi:hypothetical protein
VDFKFHHHINKLDKPHMGNVFFCYYPVHEIRTVILRFVHTCSNLASQRVYSSMLSFTVPDINSTVSKLMALGAELDGPIKYEIHGKVLSRYSHNFHLQLYFQDLRIIYMMMLCFFGFPISANAGCSIAMHRWAHARPL